MIKSIVFRPDITEMVDRVLKTNYLPTYPIAPTPHELELFTDASMFSWGEGGGARSIPLSVRVEEILLWCQSSDILLFA